MKEIDYDKFRKLLHQLREELQELDIASREASAPVELDQSKVGRLSRMDAMQGQQMAIESARRRQEQLRQIDAALSRIESGDFGYCSVCDEEIDSRRLELNPMVTRCIGCAE